MRHLTRNLVAVACCFILSAVVWIQLKKVPEPDETDGSALRVESGSVLSGLPVVNEVLDTSSLEGFQDWLSRYRTGETDPEFVQVGEELAGARRPVMLHLIRNDSATALAAALGYADYASLPAKIRSLVEQPFTTTGDVVVTAICDHDDHTPELHVDVYLEDTTRLRIEDEYAPRTGLSKLDVPLQGIRMDGWAALDARVFKTVESNDAEWALEHLLVGNPDPELDFFSGEMLAENPITVVAGGFYFQFSDVESLARLESIVRGFDNLPGKFTGSSVIFFEEAQTVQAKGFPVDQILESQNQIAINDTTGAKTSVFIRAVFSDKPDAPISKEDLEHQINTEVSGHLMNFSYGKTSMTAMVTANTYQLSRPSTDYTFNGAEETLDNQEMLDETIALYEAAGSLEGALEDFDIVGIIFPKLSSWGSAAGLGTVGGANSKHWLNGTPSTETIVHEFGHNYGLNHSNYWEFDATNAASIDPVDMTGASEEYGDLWDVMGDGDATRGHFHMAAKRYLGWLGSDQIQRIDDAPESGTYRVFRFDDAASTGLQGLEIKKANNENYWVGFRRGFKSNVNYYRGAYILWERPPSGLDRNQGWIIDTTPGSEGKRQDAGIALGRTFSDAVAGVHITPIAVGGSAPNEYIDVVVNVGAFAGNAAPQIASLDIPGSGAARTPIALAVSGTDGDGDVLAYSWDLGNGDVYASSPAVSAVFTVGGTYDVAVTITDMKGGTVRQSTQITITDPVNTWNDRSYGSTTILNGLAANNSYVIAVGEDGLILRSSNGEKWNSVFSESSISFQGAGWTGSQFLAVGRAARFENLNFLGWRAVVYASEDGSNWSEAFSGPTSDGSSNPATFSQVASNDDGSVVIVVGERDFVYKRVDDNWTKVELGLSDTTDLGITYGGGSFVLGGFDFTNQMVGLYLFQSSDGNNWADLEAASDLNPNSGLDTVAYLNDIFIGSGFNARTVFSENGGISWQTLQQGNRYRMSSFAFGNGVFYSIGEDEDNGDNNSKTLINLVSSDGKLWKEVETATAQSGNDIIFFNNSFIIVGGDSFSPQIPGFILQSEPILEALGGFAAWIDQYFKGDDADASENPDGDWAKNLLEWAVGSLPNSGDSSPAPPELVFDQAGKAVVTINRFEKSDVVTLTVEQSSNMKDWDPLSMTALIDSETVLVLVSDNVIESYPFFIRIKAAD